MPITEFLARNAAHYGDDVALVEVNPGLRERALAQPDWREMRLVERDFHSGYRKTLTWRKFDEQANQIAHLLLEGGLQPGEKVAILMMNCLEWLPVYFGVLKAGAVVVPMNFRYSSEEIRYCLNLADVRVLFFGAEFVERMAALQGQLAELRLQIFIGEQWERPPFAQPGLLLAGRCSPKPPFLPLHDEDDAAIYFSSGTTGFPKAILHSHRALVCACEVEQRHHRQGREDVFLCIPPLYHTGAKMHWFGSLLTGSRAVLLRGTSSRWILEAAANESATIVWLLVPWAQDILDALESGELRVEDYDLSAWRLMHIGAQPVPPSLIKRWKTRFPAHGYDTNYGLSESIGPGCVHLGLQNIEKVGAIGKAGYLWETKIVDEQGKATPPGQVGELAVKGPGVMRCYYKDESATQAVLRGEWLFTGDMAREDADGFIYLVDRKKDVIITGGENLYPVQIEDFLRAHPKIKDCAVIGLADYRLGEIAAAIIECKPGESCTEEEIEAFCKELPRYKRPRKIFFAPVPRNATGKIEKPKLREQYAGGSVVETQVRN
ncbi:MAG: AMP-binding protein [Oscillospiraceae bacterium]|jgi:acyl-CoA synthetase (AMP-forming)/AMP-acid ligase II|nr:AMP-binding protein [Oscillospiraceae bacterium]